MCDISNFLWDQGVHMFFWKKKQSWSIVFFMTKYFYWVSCFLFSFSYDNANQMSKKTKYLSNNGSAKIFF